MELERELERFGISHSSQLFRQIEAQLELLARNCNPMQVWQNLVDTVLDASCPFGLHQLLLERVTAFWDADSQGPFALWHPTSGIAQRTNLAVFMEQYQGGLKWQQRRTGNLALDYLLLQRLSCEEPEAFWPPVLQQIHVHFHHPADRILSSNRGSPESVTWLPGARWNIAESALRGDPNRTAIIWAAEEAPERLYHIRLGQLRTCCYAVAAALQSCSFGPGDRIAIDTPMTVESVVIYLGIILAGCVAVTIADSFAAREIAARLRIAQCKAIFTQDVVMRGGKALPLFARVAEAAAPMAIVVPADPIKGLQTELRKQDVGWNDFLSRASPSDVARFQPYSANSCDICCVLFSSGTTGQPKAIPWTHVTPIRNGVDGWAHHDLQPGDVAAWPTNLGWMMGPWLVFASLMNHAAMALFQGAPLGRPFGLFVSAAKVTMLGMVPSIVRAWRQTNCMEGLAWERHLRCFSSTGEASSPQEYHWLMAQTRYQCPIIEYCGGTELAGGYMAGSLLQPQAPGTFSMPTLGTCLTILLPDGSQSPHAPGAPPVTGEVALQPPMLGSSQQLLNADHHAVYFEGMPQADGTNITLRRHGDELQRLPGGYYAALGRSDDTMNLGGIKVSSVDLERVCLAASADIADCAAVAVPPPGGGPSNLIIFLVLRPGSTLDAAATQRTCQAAIRRQLNPLFKVERVVIRGDMPRTASNKLMRRVLRDSMAEKPSLQRSKL